MADKVERRPFAIKSDQLHGLVQASERVIAEGRFNESYREHAFALGYVLVTDSRTLIAAVGGQFAISHDAVEAYAESLVSHRYYLQIRHRPVMRRHFRRRWRVGFVLLGANRYREAPEAETFLCFSRRDTAAATAIRAELERRGVERAEWPRAIRSHVWPPPLLKLRRRSG
jgi:hypothetical protein